MNSNYIIRPVAKEDLLSIFKLEEDAFQPMHYPLFVLRQLYDIGPDLFYVATDAQQQIKGYCFGAMDHDRQIGWIFALAVIQSEQKKKIGQNLTSTLLAVFKNKNMKTVQLTTTPDNTAAIKLYEKLGFKVVKKDMDYYGDQSPRLVMTLKIT